MAFSVLSEQHPTDKAVTCGITCQPEDTVQGLIPTSDLPDLDPRLRSITFEESREAQTPLEGSLGAHQRCPVSSVCDATRRTAWATSWQPYPSICILIVQ